MINNVVNFPQFPDTTQVKPVPDVPAAAPAVTATESPAKQEDKSNLGQGAGRDQGTPPAYLLRLAIDKDPKTGEWIYKSIDRYTGQVVSVMPRSALQDLKDSASYSAGSIVKTEA